MADRAKIRIRKARRGDAARIAQLSGELGYPASAGAGAKLLQAAEEWARKRGCKGMNVRSNVIRERAHKFYEANGYEHYKTQKAFRKPL